MKKDLVKLFLLLVGVICCFLLAFEKVDVLCQPGLVDLIKSGSESCGVGYLLSGYFLEPLSSDGAGSSLMLFLLSAVGFVFYVKVYRGESGFMLPAVLASSVCLLVSGVTFCQSPRVFSWLILPLVLNTSSSEKAIGKLLLLLLGSLWIWLDFFPVYFVLFSLLVSFGYFLISDSISSKIYGLLALIVFLPIPFNPTGLDSIFAFFQMFSDSSVALLGEYRVDTANFHAKPFALFGIGLILWLRILGANIEHRVELLVSLIFVLLFEGGELFLAYFLGKEITNSADVFVKSLDRKASAMFSFYMASLVAIYIFLPLTKNQPDFDQAISKFTKEFSNEKLVYSDIFYSGALYKLGSKPFFQNANPCVYSDRGRLDSYYALRNTEPGWKEILSKHKFSQMLLPLDSSLIEVLKSTGEWNEVARGENELNIQHLGRKFNYQVVLLEKN